MRFKNIIVSGDVGTGKSTLTLNLARQLGWEFIFAGDFFRQYAKDKGIDLWDKLKVDQKFEYEVDDKLLGMAKIRKEIIIEGHYQGWRTRDLNTSFRVKTICDPDVALHRTIKRRDHTHLETDQDVIKRREGLKSAFKKLYGNDDYLNNKFFNLIVDTTYDSPSAVVKKVLEAFEKANS